MENTPLAIETAPKVWTAEMVAKLRKRYVCSHMPGDIYTRLCNAAADFTDRVFVGLPLYDGPSSDYNEFRYLEAYAHEFQFVTSIYLNHGVVMYEDCT
jgi:hypothetical protein